MKLVIHVGLPKTGSTAFQKWCNSSSSLLSKFGIYYPGSSPENGSFLCAYLQSPSPAGLAKTLKQLSAYAAEGQSRGLQTLLLSSEQIYEFSPFLKDLNTNILAGLEIIQTLSVLAICRDFQDIMLSSWRQAILASGEKRDLNEYYQWLLPIINTNRQALIEASDNCLIEYPYTSPLDFSDVIKAVSGHMQQDSPELECPSEVMPSNQESNHVLSNQSLPGFCYRFWLSCNRSYTYRAHLVSTIRLELLQGRPALRKYLLKSNRSIRSLTILLAIEGSAVKRFFLLSQAERAAVLVSQFMNHATQEQRQVAMEFLLVNDDYLYEPMFGKSHAESILSRMSGNTNRTMKLRDVLEKLDSEKAETQRRAEGEEQARQAAEAERQRVEQEQLAAEEAEAQHRAEGEEQGIYSDPHFSP